ncbi:unnamed protein product [marine sediment metagenome]|uniref:Uncharacterized protein n=1 Tax=marine sediment metagenome TaxID=412755 RepID=X1BX04_9ZZZZ
MRYQGGWSEKGNLVQGHGVLRLDKESGLSDYKDHSKRFDKDWKEFSLSKELYFARHPRIAAQFNKPF